MSKVVWKDDAKRQFATLRKVDRQATSQLLDSINLLARNPRPSGAHAYGKNRLRVRIGFYRVLYEIISEQPVIINIEHVGKSNTP